MNTATVTAPTPTFTNTPTNAPLATDHQQALAAKRTRCEVWTRVMGYHRPVSHFNVGKKSEHYSRRHFECPEGRI